MWGTQTIKIAGKSYEQKVILWLRKRDRSTDHLGCVLLRKLGTSTYFGPLAKRSRLRSHKAAILGSNPRGPIKHS